LVDAVSLLKNDRRAFITSRKDSLPDLPERACRLAPLEHIRCRYYLRMTVSDEPGVLAQIAAAMASRHVSIASVIQSAQEPAGAASLVLTTHLSNERAIRATLARLARLRCVLEQPLLLRIGDFSD
jgi:homoserine dehydrogenase